MSNNKTEAKTVADFPELVKQWHPTKNSEIKPQMISFGSTKRVWWKCQEGPDHEWKTRVAHRTLSKSGCPFCAGKKVSVTNSLASLYPDLAKEWHPKKNENLTPEKIVAGSAKSMVEM